MKKRQLWSFKKYSVSPLDPLDAPLDAEPVIPEGEFVPPGYESNPLNYQKPKSIWQKKRERKEVERIPALNKRPEWVEKLREVYPEIIGMSEEEMSEYFGKTPVEDLLKGKIAKSPLWYFSKDEDPDARPYEPADARSVQPDHYPNVMRPGGGYPEGKGHKTDAFCNSCDDQLVDGSCLRCDWGPTNRSEPIKNFPIDPFEDDKAGIRAGSWKFGMPAPLGLEGWKAKYDKNGEFGKEGWKLVSTDQEMQKAMNQLFDEKGKLHPLGYSRAKVRVMCPKGHGPLETNLGNPGCNFCKNEKSQERARERHEKGQTNRKQNIDKYFAPEWRVNWDEIIASPTSDRFANAKVSLTHKCGQKTMPFEIKRLENWINDEKQIDCSNQDCENYNFRSPAINQEERQGIINAYLEPDFYVDWNKITWKKIKRKNKKGEIFETKDWWGSSVPVTHLKCNQKSKYMIKTIENWMSNGDMPPCLNKDCEDYNPMRGKWDPSKPGFLYIYQYGNTIVIGITNNWEGRMKEYNEVRRKKIRNQKGQYIEYIPDRVDFSKTDVQYHKATTPTVKQLKERGLRPLDQKSTEATGKIQIGQNLRRRTKDRAELILNNPLYKRFRRRPERRRKQRALELLDKQSGREFYNIPENAHVFGPMRGYIAENIEKAIMQWWASLNITPAMDAQTYTESISIAGNTDGANVGGMDIGSDLNLDLHLFLIQKMIENGGHMDKISEIFSPEDYQALYGFFDNDQMKLAAAFKSSYDLETGTYGPGLNPLGDAIFPSSEQSPTAEILENQVFPDGLTERQKAMQGTNWTWGIEQIDRPPAPAQIQQPAQEVPQEMIPPEKEKENLDEEQQIEKITSYQGWSNWETWNTKLMIDNEYDLYMESRRIVEERRPLEQFAEWATQAVIAPHNQSALADAQEWNEIPYEERPTGREDMPEEARELVEGIFGDDPREDWTADIIDESKINWNEIYNSIGEDIKESEARAHEGGEHELPMEQYAGYTSEELIEAKADQHPWCPLCNPENPDAPGDLTIPDDWTGF